MSEPKHDKTTLDEVEEAIRENIRLGRMVEVSPGRFSMTEAGRKHVEQMMRKSQQ